MRWGRVLGTDAAGEAVSPEIPVMELKPRILYLRIAGKNPVRFLAWYAVDATPAPTPMTLAEVEDWMAADLPGCCPARPAGETG